MPAEIGYHRNLPSGIVAKHFCWNFCRFYLEKNKKKRIFMAQNDIRGIYCCPFAKDQGSYILPPVVLIDIENWRIIYVFFTVLALWEIEKWPNAIKIACNQCFCHQISKSLSNNGCFSQFSSISILENRFWMPKHWFLTLVSNIWKGSKIMIFDLKIDFSGVKSTKTLTK